MEAVLLVIHLIVAIGIIALVMLQPAEAGGFVGGGASNLMAPRRSADVMTRATAILAGCFFLTSLGLALLASRAPERQGVLELARETDKPAVEQTAAQPAEPETPKAPIAK